MLLRNLMGFGWPTQVSGHKATEFNFSARSARRGF